MSASCQGHWRCIDDYLFSASACCIFSPQESPKAVSTAPLDPLRTRKDDGSWERMRTHPEEPCSTQAATCCRHNGRGGRTREPRHTRIITHPFVTHSEVATHASQTQTHTKRKKIRRKKIPTTANLVLNGRSVWALGSSTSPHEVWAPQPRCSCPPSATAPG